MPLQAVFLDAGNTLLRERTSRYEIYAESAVARGADVSAERMRETMGRVHGELPREIDGAYRYGDRWFTTFIERIFVGELDLPHSVLADITDELFTRFSAPSTYELFPGALELLDGLADLGLKLGVVSNWSPRLPGILDGLGVGQRIEFVVCSAIERAEKPEPEIFQRSLALAGVPATDALHAGDHEENDVAGAQLAGLHAVLVDHEGSSNPNGVTRVGSLAELGSHIESLTE